MDKGELLLEELSALIKSIQIQHVVNTENRDNFTGYTGADKPIRFLLLCLDKILLYGLRNKQYGYWKVVRQFCQRDVLQTINQLVRVKTEIGKGRAWLLMVLNEKLLESFLVTFQHNKEHMQNYYNSYSILSSNKLQLLINLVLGLEFITFNLNLDAEFLDWSAAPIETTTPSIKTPQPLSSVSPNPQPHNSGSSVYIDTAVFAQAAKLGKSKAAHAIHGFFANNSNHTSTKLPQPGSETVLETICNHTEADSSVLHHQNKQIPPKFAGTTTRSSENLDVFLQGNGDMFSNVGSTMQRKNPFDNIVDDEPWDGIPLNYVTPGVCRHDFSIPLLDHPIEVVHQKKRKPSENKRKKSTPKMHSKSTQCDEIKLGRKFCPETDSGLMSDCEDDNYSIGYSVSPTSTMQADASSQSVFTSCSTLDLETRMSNLHYCDLQETTFFSELSKSAELNKILVPAQTVPSQSTVEVNSKHCFADKQQFIVNKSSTCIGPELCLQIDQEVRDVLESILNLITPHNTTVVIQHNQMKNQLNMDVNDSTESNETDPFTCVTSTEPTKLDFFSGDSEIQKENNVSDGTAGVSLKNIVANNELETDEIERELSIYRSGSESSLSSTGSLNGQYKTSDNQTHCSQENHDSKTFLCSISPLSVSATDSSSEHTLEKDEECTTSLKQSNVVVPFLIEIDQSLRVKLMIDIVNDEDEVLLKMIKVSPGEDYHCVNILLFSNKFVYVLEHEMEIYSKKMHFLYSSVYVQYLCQKQGVVFLSVDSNKCVYRCNTYGETMSIAIMQCYYQSYSMNVSTDLDDVCWDKHLSYLTECVTSETGSSDITILMYRNIYWSDNQVSTLKSESQTKSGSLSLKSGKNLFKRDRWISALFILDNENLYRFKNRCWPLSQLLYCQLLTRGASTFEIATNNDKIELLAKTPSDAKDWTIALQLAIEAQNKENLQLLACSLLVTDNQVYIMEEENSLFARCLSNILFSDVKNVAITPVKKSCLLHSFCDACQRKSGTCNCAKWTLSFIDSSQCQEFVALCSNKCGTPFQENVFVPC